MRFVRSLFWPVLLLALLGAAAWAWRAHSLPRVTVAEAERGTAVHAVYATGVVEPVHWAKVTPLVRGRIADICACEGETVARGAFLARLESGEEEAAYAEIDAEARFLADELKRQRDLFSRGVASSAAHDRALSAYTKAEAALAAARERLDDLILRAPLNGVVLRQDGEIGEVVAPGEVLFWVGRPKPLWVEAEVDEEDIPDVAPGQRVLIKADAFPGRVFEGRVARITPKGDPLNKSYRVRIDLPADSPLLIGMTAEANIVIRTVADAVLVPTGALRGSMVWLLDAGGRVVPRPVETGIRGDARTEIVAGLEPGARIVVDPPEGLGEGTRVRIAGGGE